MKNGVKFESREDKICLVKILLILNLTISRGFKFSAEKARVRARKIYCIVIQNRQI